MSNDAASPALRSNPISVARKPARSRSTGKNAWRPFGGLLYLHLLLEGLRARGDLPG